MDYEPTPKKQYQTAKPTRRRISVMDGKAKARADYRAAARQHRQAIKRLRADIRRHKLLIRQARTLYKLNRI